MWLRSFVVASLWFSIAVAQDPVPAAPTEKPKLLRVHVIGASVSAGFRDGPMFGAEEVGESVSMQQLLKAWCGEHARVSTHNVLEMMQMFTGPERIGKAQVDLALKNKADAVVAIDFPFWFAYGFVPGDEKAARLQLLEQGLAQLERLTVPVLVGDLPDFTGAAQRMLRPAQIPSKEVLQALNETLAAWVKAHANVRQVQLGELVRTMKDQGAKLPLAAGPLASPPGALLQGDRLHANRLGMALLGHTMQDALHALFPEGHALRTQTWAFDAFVPACGAEADLEAVRAAKQAPAAAPGVKR